MEDSEGAAGGDQVDAAGAAGDTESLSSAVSVADGSEGRLPQLMEGWLERIDEQGRRYFINNEERISQYEFPTRLVNPEKNKTQNIATDSIFYWLLARTCFLLAIRSASIRAGDCTMWTTTREAQPGCDRRATMRLRSARARRCDATQRRCSARDITSATRTPLP